MEILKLCYNILPDNIAELDGDVNYSNRKYLVTDSAGVRYILKNYTDPYEIKLVREECRILAEVGPKLDLRVPVTIPNLEGNLLTEAENGTWRLLSYIEGDFLGDVDQSPELIGELGCLIGKLNRELSLNRSDIMGSRKLFWDLQYSQLNYKKSEFISDPADRKLIEYYFDRFHTYVLPLLIHLRSSLIHGDLNDYNILVSDNHISGVIDFGDISVSNVINELAIASAYIMLGKSDPFEAVLPLIKGFNKEVRLLREELELLPDLITTRLAVSLCNSAEKRATGEANEYVLVSEKPAWDLLKRWIEMSPLRFKEMLFESAGYKADPIGHNVHQVIERREKYFSKSMALSYSSPIYLDSALFQFMYDRLGNTYLDAYNNIPHIGYSHPAVSRAICNQTRSLNTNTRYLYDSLGKYSERILDYFPKRLNRIFYVNSGSAASDLAIRLSRNFRGRNNLLVMDHGYHGNTTTGISISPYKFDGKGGKGTPEGITKLPLPNLYRGNFKSGSEYANDAIARIQKLLDQDIMPAAFIAEPISGCGGQVPVADRYLIEVYKFLKENGIVTISDEVQVGFGRLGEWFWGFEMHNVEPDIVVLGKPMGNGHPIGAVVTTAEISDAFANGMEFFSSFGGNPVSCEVANAVLQVIEDEDLQNNASNVGNYYLECSRQLMKEHKVIGDVRGSGLFIGIEFTCEDGSAATSVANRVKNRLKEEYILTGTDGPYNNVIKSKPPLCFNKQNVDRVITTMDKILRED